MQKEYGKELFEIMGNFHKLTHQAKPIGKISKGEFIMLCSIIDYISQNERRDNKETGDNKEPGVRVTELSNMLKASKPATSKMLNSMEEKNYIIRITDKKDRRMVYVNLTEKGNMVFEETKQSFSQYTKHLLNELGEEDTKELIRIFKKLYQIFSEE